AVTLAAGERADLLLLVLAGERETRDVCAGRHLARAELHDVSAPGDLFENGSVTGQRAILIDISDADRFAEPDGATIGFLLTDDHSEERCLARPVRTDHSDDASGRQLEGHLIH